MQICVYRVGLLRGRIVQIPVYLRDNSDNSLQIRLREDKFQKNTLLTKLVDSVK